MSWCTRPRRTVLGVLAALWLLGAACGGSTPARSETTAGRLTVSAAASLTGARMLFALVTVTASVFIVTMLTPPEPMEGLKKFLLMARPFSFGWKPVIRELGQPYDPVESFGRTMVSWFIGIVMVMALIYGIGELIIGETLFGLACLALSAISLVWTLVRFKQDYQHELKAYGKHP